MAFRGQALCPSVVLEVGQVNCGGRREAAEEVGGVRVRATMVARVARVVRRLVK